MTIDFDGDKKTARKSERAERNVAKTPGRKITRPRPGGSVHADRLAVPKPILDAYPESQFMYFWENDEKGKVEIREQRGWVRVQLDMADGKMWEPGEQRTYTGGVVKIPVGRGETTDSMYSVLMMMPREWYEDDIAEQENHNQEVRNSLRRGPNANTGETDDGVYAARLSNGKYGLSEKFDR